MLFGNAVDVLCLHHFGRKTLGLIHQYLPKFVLKCVLEKGPKKRSTMCHVNVTLTVNTNSSRNSGGASSSDFNFYFFNSRYI